MALRYSTETMERRRPKASAKKSLLLCFSMFSVRRRKAKQNRGAVSDDTYALHRR